MIGRGTVHGVPVIDPGKAMNPGPGMSDAGYRRLVARNGKQLWTEQDEKDLQSKVRRLRDSR